MEQMIHYLGRTLQELGRGYAESLRLTLALPLSQGEMTLPPGKEIPPDTVWVRIPHPVTGASLMFHLAQSTRELGESSRQSLLLQDILSPLQSVAIPGYIEVGGTTLASAAAQLLSLDPQGRFRPGHMPDIPVPVHALENQDLLSALLTLLSCHPHLFLTADTETFPWTLHVKSAPEETPCQVRLSRNIRSLTITEDRSALCTQLIPLGYGEGADQLTIRSVNGGEISLVADTAARYGLIQAIFVDRSITHADALKAAGEAVLAARCRPVRSIRISGEDLSAHTREPLDHFRPGTYCQVALPDLGIREAYQVQEVTWPDAAGDPCQVTVTLGQTDSLSGALQAMGRALHTASHCSQGAPNQYVLPFQDNADPAHPAVLPFYLDQDTLHVNDLRLMISLQPFRAYSRSARSGGAATATTEQYIAQERTVVSTPPQDTGGNYARYTDPASDAPGTTHRHGFSHVHRVPIILQLPALKISIPAHSHGLDYGVYEGETAAALQVQVDGAAVPDNALQGNGTSFTLDAAPYLKRDSQGRITRGAWHEIRIIPDRLTRIHAAVYIRSFLRSLQGKNM